MAAFAVMLSACLVIRDRFTPLYLAGALAALYCVVLSGSRGTLIAIVPILIFLLWWSWRRDDWRRVRSWRRLLLFPVILLFLGAVLVSYGQFVDRGWLAASQTNDYFERGDASTSIGLRLEMWRSTWIVAREHPLLGIGERQLQKYLKYKIAAGELNPDVAIMRNSHSDYLTALQSRGVPGLILQLLIYALPMAIFIRGLAVTRGEHRFASLGGVLTTIGYATYSLTQTPLYYGLTLIFYIVSIGLLIGIIKHAQSPVSADHSR